MDGPALRRARTRRTFPAMTREIYSGEQASAAGRWLCAMAHPTLTAIGRYTGFGLDPAGRLARLLMLHRLAFEAECAGAFRRADFLWREFHGGLQRAWADTRVWASAFDPGAGHTLELADGEALRTRVLEEIVIDAHCAFYNGRVAEDGAVDAHDRAFMHAERIAELADLSKMPGAQARHLIEPPARARIEALRRDGKWAEAVLACETLLRRLPSALECQDELADLLRAEAVSGAGAGAGDSGAQLAAAARLEQAIARIEVARQRYPRNPAFYRALARCHLARAIALANGGSVSAALAAARWAGICDPDLGDARIIEEQLCGIMSDLQARMKEVQATLAANPAASLNEQGERMRYDAEQGLGPLAEVERSERAREIGGMFHAAVRERSCAAPAARPTLEEAPLLAPAAQSARDAEPAVFWMLSRQDLGAKLQLAAAAMLIVTAAAFYIDAGRQRAVREAAYRELMEASASDSYERTMSAAEKYLSARTARADARDDQVRRAYDQAFARWFVTAAAHPEAPDVAGAAQRYRTLRATLTPGEAP